MAKGERLIVEDEEDARNQAVRVTTAGMKEIIPVTVASVGEALKKLAPAEETFHDIVTDGNLPDGNCADIVNAATAKVPPIPVIIWSNDNKLGETLETYHKKQGHDVIFVDKGRGDLTKLIRT